MIPTVPPTLYPNPHNVTSTHTTYLGPWCGPSLFERNDLLLRVLRTTVRCVLQCEEGLPPHIPAGICPYMGITHGHMPIYGYNPWSYRRFAAAHTVDVTVAFSQSEMRSDFPVRSRSVHSQWFQGRDESKGGSTIVAVPSWQCYRGSTTQLAASTPRPCQGEGHDGP